MTLAVHHATGTRSIRVIWLLEELGVAHERVAEPYPPRTQHPEYLQINSTGTIPAVVEAGRVLTESMAICQVLAEEHGRPDLQVEPGSPDRAAYLQWLWYGEATLPIPAGIMARVRRLSTPAGTELLIEDVRLALSLRLNQLEAALADGRSFIVVGRFTLADISVAYTLLLADRLGVGALVGARSRAYIDSLKARPALQRALELN